MDPSANNWTEGRPQDPPHREFPLVYVPKEYPMQSPYMAPPRRTHPWIGLAVLALVCGAGLYAWDKGMLPWQHDTQPMNAWWVGTWDAEGEGVPSLTLRTAATGIAGEITFRLNAGYLARQPVLNAQATDTGLVFYLPNQSYYMLVPGNVPEQAELYRLRNLATARAQAGPGQAPVLIPVDHDRAHQHIAHLIRQETTPARLDLPRARETTPRPATPEKTDQSKEKHDPP